MKKVGLVAAGLAVGVAAVLLVSAEAPNPVTCEGYPERRVFLENQSWVDPQPGDPSHPGTGKQGHIHISTCFPLMQEVTSDTLSLDFRVQMHNVPGIPTTFVLNTYRVGGREGRMNIPYKTPCLVADCDFWMHVDFPLSEVTESGWTEFHIYLHVRNTDGKIWYNLPRWWFNLQNGAPDSGNVNNVQIGGDTWLSADVVGEGSGNYNKVIIAPEDYPWDFETGEMIPISGTWQPRIDFQSGTFGMVLIDPVLHANPPDRGLVVHEGDGSKQTLSIDTTELSDGIHRLTLISCDERPSGTDNCGVLVVRFLVDNAVPPTTTEPSSTTTEATTTTESVTTTTVVPADVTLTPGQSYIVDCPTVLDMNHSSNRAELMCGE